VKDRLAELRPIVGVGAAVMMKVTGIFCGVFVAPEAVRVIMPG
jgi:hypothetical protein